MRKMHGFTLVELMITITVFALMLAIGVPSFQSTIMNNRMTSQINAFVTALNQARSEAVKQNQRVTVCVSTDGSTCAGAGVNNWESGWIVFVDRNTDGIIDDGNDCANNATDDCVLSVHAPLNGNTTMRSGNNAVSYTGSGASNGTRTFTMCDSRGGSHSRAIIVSLSGRPRISETEADGSALSCPA